MRKLGQYNYRTFFCAYFIFGLIMRMNAQDSANPSFPPIVDTINTSHKDSIQYFDLVKNPPVISLRKVPDTTIVKLKKDAAYWYADKAPAKNRPVKENEKKNGNSFLNSKWFNSFIWILITGGFISILIWYLTSGNINLFRKRAYHIKDDNNVLLEEEDIDPAEYSSVIQNAINNGNFSLAIRYLYLQTLSDLSEKDLIILSGSSTNSDYLLQLRGTPYYNSFFNLTRNFEFSWYGKFDISEYVFDKIYREFNSLKQQIQ